MTASASDRPVVKTGVGAQHITRGKSDDNGQCPTARDEFTAWLTTPPRGPVRQRFGLTECRGS
jgi:hypothetical protein